MSANAALNVTATIKTAFDSMAPRHVSPIFGHLGNDRGSWHHSPFPGKFQFWLQWFFIKMVGLKLLAKAALKPLIYRFPPIMLAPERLMLWQQTLIETMSVGGDVVEVGCYLGGTAAVSARMMRNLGDDRQYRVYDTFSGFTDRHWALDAAKGIFSGARDDFSSNSPRLTRWVLDRHGGKNVEIHQGDITSLPDSALPARISACLLDVDLTEPIYLGLKRLHPRLGDGGIILIDDCDDKGWYRAKIGYERYLAELGKSPTYKYGMGILRKG
ncbi:TylF/MycF/NovP-related O-methyltransferase [Bradyrhizobium sp.]|nr:TylF/MycF/NovP-related O-methyltransferase [Bradyrhizobium sp.]